MRNTTSTIDTAQANSNSFAPLAKIEIFPSLISFGAITRDYAITGADTLPASNDPMRQDIIYNATAGLVTFYADGSLKYALDGDSTPVTTTTSSSIKPGLYGNKIYVQVGSDVLRRTVNWSNVVSKSTDPFSADATLTPTDTPVAVHGISETECVVVGDGDGGLSLAYFSGTSENLSPSRFMFPSLVDWTDSDRDMESLGIFTTALKLGNRIFVYASNAPIGSVQGIFYDLDTETWSDIFVALPTDLEVSMCEFRVANSFVRNNKAYIVGQFIRTDLYQTNKPYTLILASDDGIYFSIDRFSFVTALGYRFLGTVGSDNNLYLANSNRVCESPVTWVFDGDDDSTSLSSIYTMDHIISINFNEQNGGIRLKAGDEQVYDDTNIVAGARLKLYDGLKTSIGDEYILFGTYIVASKKEGFYNGKREFNLSIAQEGQWKLAGLSMPFYAEWQGLSSIYDPMTDESGKLYAAPGLGITDTKFWVDFWTHIGFADSVASITAIQTIVNGGVSTYSASGSHKLGIILKNDISSVLGINTNPKITASTLPVLIYGWSRPEATGNQSDIINIIIETCDKDGKSIQTVITTETDQWPQTYPDIVAGEKPISYTVSGTGIADGRYLKRIGLVFEQTNSTTFCPARVEVTGNVEVDVPLTLSNTPWEAVGDGTFKVPAHGQPFLMFSQRPYNAFNFDLTASFENTVTGGITGYPVATGLVGLAEDALNYVIARYDKVADKVQLVKVRNGIETQLAQATPGWSLGDLHEINFYHKDGTFVVSMLNEGTGVQTQVLSYDWTASDGFMTTSKIITQKCGIWGGIISPSIMIAGYAGRSQDTVSITDGLPIDPLADISDFPTSGELEINENIYTYDSWVFPPTYIPGPYQVRNNALWPPPFGNGKAGIECHYFDWNEDPNKYIGKFIALDNGSNFISAGSLYRVYITTSGAKVWLRNRSRHYSDNAQASKIGVSLANRMFPALGGFEGLTLIEGKAKRHSWRERAFLHLSGDIICYWYMGTGGQRDVTVRDLVKTTSALCGVKATFPGDYVDTSLSVSGVTNIFQDDYSEGFDLEYEIASPTTHEIRTNVIFNAENYDNSDDYDGDTGLKVVLTDLGSGNYRAALVSTPSDTIVHQRNYTSGTQLQRFRILFHSEGVSIYHNDKWAISIAVDELIFTSTNYVDIDAYTASPTTFSNVYVHDLNDIREAIYIDLETDGMSALNSIIQERPVEIGPDPDGGVHFFYDESNRDNVTLTKGYSHRHTNSLPTDSISDAIVYGSGEVVTLTKPLFANTFGLSTKIIRVPSLDVGAPEAAYRMMKVAYENKDRHEISGRPDMRIQVGDLLTLSYTLSGTGKQLSPTVIVVERLERSLMQSGAEITARMEIAGRGYLSE